MARRGSATKAGERTRTVNIQLGRLTLYQLSYARSVVAHCSIGSHSVAKSRSSSRLRLTRYPWQVDRYLAPSSIVSHLIVLQLLGVYLRHVVVACASCADGGRERRLLRTDVLLDATFPG